MNYRLFFCINALPKTPNSLLQKHWRANNAEAKKWKRLVWQQCLSQMPPKILDKARVTLIRYSSSEPDFDGLVGSFKHVLDGLVEARVIATDKMSCIGAPTYSWEKVAPKNGRIEITVESL